MNHLTVTVTGPVARGKSTVAHAIKALFENYGVIVDFKDDDTPQAQRRKACAWRSQFATWADGTEAVTVQTQSPVQTQPLMRDVAIEHANGALARVREIIDRTPTGPRRVKLCDAQIHLCAAIDIMKEVM